MTTPLVSIIIISYRTRELTLRCVATLKAMNSAVPCEIVVVDNASDDGSADAVATTHPDVRIIRMAQNVGFGRAVNQGAAAARGSYLFLFNTDAEPVGDPIAELVGFATAQPHHRLYTARTLDADGNDDGLSIFGLPSLWSCVCHATGLSTVARQSRLFNPEALPGLDRATVVAAPAVSGCAVLIDREFFLALGGFTPDFFMYSEDIDLGARACAAGASPVLVPQSRVVHAGGGSSTSVNQRVMVLRGRSTYFRLHWSRPKAWLGRTLTVTGVGLRAAGSRLTGRADYWREVWRQRAVWIPGWPPAPSEPAPSEPTPSRGRAPAAGGTDDTPAEANAASVRSA